VGDKGLIGSDARIIPEEKQRQFAPPPKSLRGAQRSGAGRGTVLRPPQRWKRAARTHRFRGPVDGVRLAGPPWPQYAGVGKKVHWDAEKMECTNMPELNKLPPREYRKGWEVL